MKRAGRTPVLAPSILQHESCDFCRRIRLQPMTGLHEIEASARKMRLELLCHPAVEVRIMLTPNYLDGHRESFQLRITCSIEGNLGVEFGRHLNKCKTGARLLGKVLFNQGSHKLLKVSPLRHWQMQVKLLTLPIQHPSKLRGRLRNGHRQRAQCLCGEDLDEFGPSPRRRFAVRRVKHHQRNYAMRVIDSEIDPGGARRIVNHRSELVKA